MFEIIGNNPLTGLVYLCYTQVDPHGLFIIKEAKSIQSFHKLDKQKQIQILNAAMKEFAEKGYKRASTNQIVNYAGIGKGMLFYYFKTKQELYYYLIDYGLDFVESEYLNKVNMEETDFIERIKQATKIKMKSYANHPDLFHFLGTIFMSENIDLPESLQKKYEKFYQLGYSLLYDNIDTSLFRSDVDVEKAFQLIQWAIDGYQNNLIHRLQGKNLSSYNFDPLWEEFFEYLNVLKTAFYNR